MAESPPDKRRTAPLSSLVPAITRGLLTGLPQFVLEADGPKAARRALDAPMGSPEPAGVEARR